MTTIDFTDKKLYVVFPFEDDLPQLTNMLKALAYYKHKVGAYWPKKVAIRQQMVLEIGYGEDIEIVRDKWPQLDILYFSVFEPHEDPPDYREANERLTKKRPVEDETGKIIRKRIHKYQYQELISRMATGV